MKKVLIVLSNIFRALTFCGAAYVIYTDGRTTPFYAVMPMFLCLGLRKWSQSIQNKM